MAPDAPLTDDNAHVAALCSMMELFLQHGLNPTAPRRAKRVHVLSTPALRRADRRSSCLDPYSAVSVRLRSLSLCILCSPESSLGAGMDGHFQGGSGRRRRWLRCMPPLLRPRRLTLTWALTSCAPDLSPICCDLKPLVLTLKHKGAFVLTP